MYLIDVISVYVISGQHNERLSGYQLTKDVIYNTEIYDIDHIFDTLKLKIQLNGNSNQPSLPT